MKRLTALLSLPIVFLGTTVSCDELVSLSGLASSSAAGDTGLVDTASGGDLDPCDALDNDGDGRVDEDGVTWYADLDGDGFGDPSSTAQSCTQPRGFTSNGSDCGPGKPNVYPGAPERCSEGLDADCDGLLACEDGDCASHASCVEDCWDRSDDDEDGYTDGLDEDCWSERGAVIRSRLGGGRLDFFVVDYRTSHYVSGGSMEGSAYSLTGSATLMSASGSVVCQWEVPQVHVDTSYLTVWSAVSTGGHSEAAVNLSSGCPAALERHVLPPYLSGADVQKGSSWRQLELRVEGPSGPWYSGTAELKSYRRSRWSGGSSEAATATVPALNPTTATWSP